MQDIGQDLYEMETYADIRQVIEEAKQVTIIHFFSNGQPGSAESPDEILIPVSKEYALGLYKGLRGATANDGRTVLYNVRTKTVFI